MAVDTVRAWTILNMSDLEMEAAVHSMARLASSAVLVASTGIMHKSSLTPGIRLCLHKVVKQRVVVLEFCLSCILYRARATIEQALW